MIDTGATVTAGAGCTAPAAHEGHCAANPGQTRLEINADDEDDYVNILPGTLNLAIVDGGAGEDELIGGGARSGNLLDGGPGADILEGRATANYDRRTNPVTVTVGDDLANDGEAGEGDFVSSEIIAVFGGEGDDDLTILNSPGVQERTELIGGGGSDTLSILRHPFGGSLFGGGGPDTIRNEAKNGLVHGANGDDLIFGGDGPQALWGEGGDDALRGLDGDDFLLGNRGADIFLPGPGNDSVAGGHGPDTIFARDGQRDSLAAARARKTARESTEGSTRSMTWRGSFDASVHDHRGCTLRPRLGRCRAGRHVLLRRRRSLLHRPVRRDEPRVPHLRREARPRISRHRLRRRCDPRSGLHICRPHEAFCAIPNFPDHVLVSVDDMNDYVNAWAAVPGETRLEGGDGNDALYTGQDFAAVMDGGAGADVFEGELATVDYSSRTTSLTVTKGDGLANDGEAGGERSHRPRRHGDRRRGGGRLARSQASTEPCSPGAVMTTSRRWASPSAAWVANPGTT